MYNHADQDTEEDVGGREEEEEADTWKRSEE
jgi:hypothetical protein